MSPCYLVTGCCGFIGARTTGLLLEQGHQVVGVDNLNDAYDVRLKEWRLAQLEDNSGFRFHQVDICDREALLSLFHNGTAAIINLAARAGVRASIQDPWTYFDTNVTGTLNLLELARERGIPKFVQASSSSVYGAGCSLPLHEDLPTERPLSPYAASKKASEVLCHSYHYLYGMDITVLRYFTVYGPAGRPDMSLFRFVQWVAEGRPVTIYGDGSQSRDFTYVDDIALGTLAALQPLPDYQVINLGSDHPVVLLDALCTIEAELGKKGSVEHTPPTSADVPATWADVTLARELLGWQPRTTFQTGIVQMVRWYLDNHQWANSINTT